jgi:hypothetical protein
MKPELKVPRNLSPLARACLEKLAEHGELVSVGGAIGLSYYLEYRPTADVEAWWESGNAAERAGLIGEVEAVLRRFGNVRRRSWGDVVSVELLLEDWFELQLSGRPAIGATERSGGCAGAAGPARGQSGGSGRRKNGGSGCPRRPS